MKVYGNSHKPALTVVHGNNASPATKKVRAIRRNAFDLSIFTPIEWEMIGKEARKITENNPGTDAYDALARAVLQYGYTVSPEELYSTRNPIISDIITKIVSGF